MHHICRTCDRDFTTRDGLEKHWINSSRHAYCRYCDEHFSDRDELGDHYDTEHHLCALCSKVFLNELGFHEHNRQSHPYCVECKRVFQSANNLRAHLNSSVHTPKAFSCGCGQAYVSKSALLLHMESGYCKRGMNRQRLNDAIIALDRSNVITNPARLIGGPGQHVHSWATERSWNGEAYECYFCHSTFRSLKALNAHLQSPRHEEKIYVCPKSDCRQQFSVLSALCQHVESEKCGVVRFREVKAVMDSFVSGMRRLTAA